MTRSFSGRVAFGLVLSVAVVLAYAAGADASQGPAGHPGRGQGPVPVVGAGEPGAIKDRYVVVFDKGTSSSQRSSAKAEARRRGATVHFDYGSALQGFAATLPEQALDGLRRNPNVAYIEADHEVELTASQANPTWGLDRIDQRALPLNSTYNYDFVGSNVTAYVIDTGVRTTHTQFGGRAVSGYDSIDGGAADDCNGHGTHVAGTVGGSTYGVAKSVRIVAVRVLNCQGSGSISGVAAGIDWVTSNHQAGQPAVANMSLGGSVSASLDTAVRNSIADGVTYVVAAGNENTDACNRSPSRVAEALTVGATSSSDARASYSNWGTCVDIFAPGSSITSAWSTSDTATNTISGTSMAAPHGAGVAALYLQGNPSEPPASVLNAIASSATTGVVTNPGSGSPNRLLYSLFGSTTPPPPPPPPGCGLAQTYTGSLTGTGDYDYQPNGTYYYSGASGTHRGCLRGPSGPDFDLYLYKWSSSGGYWYVVARSEGLTSSEDISYAGSAGYYLWEVNSYSGSGSYEFGLTRP